MELYGCGLNVHKQLDSGTSQQNINTFQKIVEGSRIKVSCATLSATVVDVDGRLIYQGYHESTPSGCTISHAEGVKSFIGDIEGLHGALTVDGNLMQLVYDGTSSETLLLRRRKQSGLGVDISSLEQAIVGGNGELAVVATRSHEATKSAYNLYMLPSLAKLFMTNLSDAPASTVTVPANTYLTSTAASFLALVNDGKVLSWGSVLHPQLLARHPTPDSPAEIPCVIPFLEGIQVRKIVSGGWICAAISHSNDLYIWGGEPEIDTAKRISCLPDWRGGEDVKLVDIDGGLDVLDAAVGEGHVVALTEKGDVWVTGEGYEGQLGLGNTYREFVQDWTRVNGWGNRTVLNIEAGGWNTFVGVSSFGSRNKFPRTWPGNYTSVCGKNALVPGRALAKASDCS